MVGYDSGFPGGFVAGVKRGVWVGFSFTVLGSDGLMLVFLGLAGLLWSPFVARVFLSSLLSSYGDYRRF